MALGGALRAKLVTLYPIPGGVASRLSLMLHRSAVNSRDLVLTGPKAYFFI
jgi:hypothetical protein